MFQVKSKTSRMDLMKNAIYIQELEAKFNSMNKTKRLLEKSRDNYNAIRDHLKTFGVLDVNDRKYISRGTSFPKQYERYPTHENKEQRNLLADNDENDKEVRRKLNKITLINNKDIKYKPKDLSYYELLLREQDLIEKDLKLKHPFMKKFPHLTIQDIRQKNHDSHVLNIPSENNETKSYRPCLTNPNYNHYRDSDVFLLKDKKNILMKKYPPYSLVQQSNSEWVSRNSLPSFMNHSSVQYNPLNGYSANVALTKDNIISKGLRTDSNTYHRQKGISEFVELTRINAPRTNKSMKDWLEQTKGDFKKDKGMCSEYGDSYKSYEGLVAKPFTQADY